jgi:hypothetical protein
MFICYACARYAYHVNEQRPEDDPKKRDFHRKAILLAPLTWGLFIFGSIIFFLLRALLYGVFLILFTLALLVIRKPFLIQWLRDTALRIGDRLLAANTFIIRLAFGD